MSARATHFLPWTLVLLWAAWLSLGIFPIAPIEGDEQGVISGATALARNETTYLELAYLPAIQPGAYALLAAAHRFGGLEVETAFALGSVAGALLFAALAARLLAVTLALPAWLTLAALLASQEISAAAYYMNTTALGLWLAFLALLLATRAPTWRTVSGIAVGLAVAGWIRIDCLLVAPAVPVLLWRATRDLRTTGIATAVAACTALILVVALYSACGVTWLDFVSPYAERGAIHGWGPTLRDMPLILSPLGCWLLAVGLLVLALRQEGMLVALIIAGCAATLPIYGTSLASTKYFYHLVPFFLIAVLTAARALFDFLAASPAPARRVAFAGVALVLFADQALGLHTSSDFFRRYRPDPVLATLATWPAPSARGASCSVLAKRYPTPMGSACAPDSCSRPSFGGRRSPHKSTKLPASPRSCAPRRVRPSTTRVGCPTKSSLACCVPRAIAMSRPASPRTRCPTRGRGFAAGSASAPITSLMSLPTTSTPAVTLTFRRTKPFSLSAI
jgi:hypothetical protein